jgi:hypothetical protein
MKNISIGCNYVSHKQNLFSVVVKKCCLLVSGLLLLISFGSADAAQLIMNVKNEHLGEVLQEIRVLSGSQVKVAPALQADKVANYSLNEGWQVGLEHLLTGYNYMVVWGGNGLPRELIVYSRNDYSDQNSGTAFSSTPVIASEELFSYQGVTNKLPSALKGLNPNAVNQISLPVERMKTMEIGEKIAINLPSGEFEVIHDKQFVQENGDVTWVGFLLDAGQNYRVMINLTSNNVVGRIITPSGEYDLQTADGRLWLVDNTNVHNQLASN